MLMIEKIANEFGLELEQEFTIHENKYKFTKDGLFWYDTCRQDWFLENDTLGSLITGELNEDLIKIKWKPKHNEIYYCPCIRSSEHICTYKYVGDSIDNYYLNNGLMCKTYDYIIEKVKEYRNYDI